jgi:hypothetical protein
MQIFNNLAKNVGVALLLPGKTMLKRGIENEKIRIYSHHTDSYVALRLPKSAAAGTTNGSHSATRCE